MKIKTLALMALMALIGTAMVASLATANQPVTSMAVECNWGKLTMEAGPQGNHASDPSGDGKGPEERVGLANVIEKGNLQATCAFIEGLGDESYFGSTEPAVTSMSVKCNWGMLTMEATPMGQHASDPSDDGKGPEERVGLANLIERGNLQLVCEALSNE